MDRSEWVLVNGEMLQVGADALEDYIEWGDSYPDAKRYECVDRIFRAMLAAAPPPPAEQASGELLADLELVWHSVSDDRETNAAYERLKAALSQRPVVSDEMVERAAQAISRRLEPDCEWSNLLEMTRNHRREEARIALTAALAPQQQGGS